MNARALIAIAAGEPVTRVSGIAGVTLVELCSYRDEWGPQNGDFRSANPMDYRH